MHGKSKKTTDSSPKRQTELVTSPESVERSHTSRTNKPPSSPSKLRKSSKSKPQHEEKEDKAKVKNKNYDKISKNSMLRDIRTSDKVNRDLFSSDLSKEKLKHKDKHAKEKGSKALQSSSAQPESNVLGRDQKLSPKKQDKDARHASKMSPKKIEVQNRNDDGKKIKSKTKSTKVILSLFVSVFQVMILYQVIYLYILHIILSCLLFHRSKLYPLNPLNREIKSGSIVII